MRRFQKLNSADRDIVFYSESGSYWKYFEPFINSLINDHNRKVCYITSEPDDPVLQTKNPGIHAFHIGDKTIRTIFFASLNANILLMTLLDLDKAHIKRSKHPVHYIFLPHNMNSTNMVFRKGAYDHFDTVFCVGPHHVAEIREAEKMYGLKKKSLVENGYAPLDAIYKKAKNQKPLKYGSPLNILIAPSWGEQSLLEIGADDLVNSLLAAGHHVTVRPHRNTKRLESKKVNNLYCGFSDHPNFEWHESSSTEKLLFQSHLLVTDWSGSAFSFSFGLERPVLFIETPMKVKNTEYKKFKNQPVETTIRDKIGARLQLDNLSKAAEICEKLCANQKEFSEKIIALRKDMVYNIGGSAKKGADYISELSDNLRNKRSLYNYLH